MPADFIRANLVAAALLAASLGVVYSVFKSPSEPDHQVLVLHQYLQDRDIDRDGAPDCGNAGPNGTPDDCDDGPDEDDDTTIQI